MNKTIKIKVSVIIVHYRAKKLLFDCLASIGKGSKHEFEIIVVDNDERKSIAANIKAKFPKIKYIRNENRGFGQGNNIGAKEASGDYLFFLNPDTKVYPGILDFLVDFLEKHKKTGIVAPLLLNKNEKPYPLQGTQILTPIRALFAYSFLDKIFPNNPVSRGFWLKRWDKSKLKEVDVVPGTAFMIRADLFHKTKFDERFFLYFEEYDLCKRVRDLGFKIYILPKAKLIHYWGESTGVSNLNIKKVFEQSRFFYFKKHFGIFKALFVSFFLGINKINVVLFLILFFGFFLRFYKLSELMMFIGDFGWFYIQARDILLLGTIPLVGIESSHPWLHQGPFWTYIVAFMFFISNFNPISPAYFSIMLDVGTIYLMYKIGSLIFSKKIGLISAYLYAFSPLVVTYSRLPYHTSPIPFFTLVYLYALFKWIRGEKIFFSIAVLILGVLYNFELATVSLVFVLLGILLFGVMKKKRFASIFNKKILLSSTLALIISMFPILLYDLKHGFPQTLKFGAWMGYKLLRFLGFPPLRPEISEASYFNLINFTATKIGELIFAPNALFSLLLLISGCLFLIIKIKISNDKTNYFLLGFLLLVISSSYFLAKTPSSAYLPVFFPIIFLMLGILFSQALTKRTVFSVSLLLIIVGVVNVYHIFVSDFNNAKQSGIKERLFEAKKIVEDAQDAQFQLVGARDLSTEDKRIDNYKYLVWWEGGKLSSTSNLIYTIHVGAKKEITNPVVISGNITVSKEVIQ